MPSTRAVPFICGRAHNDKENRMSATTIPHRRAAALLALSFIGCIVAAHAADAKPALAAKPTLSDVIKASAPSDWRPLDPSRTLYMELPAGRVVIELAPAFAPQTVANIETLVREHYFDGLAVIRSQDNFVAQWGDADEAHPKSLGTAKEKVAAEFTVPMSAAQHFVRQRDSDGYAPQIGHADGMPAGRDPKTRTTWLAHCYGMVGVGRDNDSDSGNGSGLYAVTGHGPRQLDRNITLVGRVVSGMDLLSTLPRGRRGAAQSWRSVDQGRRRLYRLVQRADTGAPDRQVSPRIAAPARAATDSARPRMDLSPASAGAGPGRNPAAGSYPAMRSAARRPVIIAA